jgi:polyhydroxyalkanoate synthase
MRGRNLADIVRGRRKARVGATPADSVWQRGRVDLLRYEGSRQGVPLLMVPSLINQHYILDLQPGKSLVEFLLGRGFDVFMIRWGKPGAEDRHLSFDDHVELLLGGAVAAVRKITDEPGMHLLGYCVGGILSTIYGALHPERMVSMINLATPVDFHRGGTLALWMDRRYMDVDLLVDALGNVPWPLMQVPFHLLKPTAQATKLVYAADRLWDERFLDSFLALETWANDNVSFPGECYRRYIRDLYQDNLLVQGKLRIGGRRVDLGRIACPLLSVAAHEDHIVPLESARAISAAVAHTEEVLVDGGHIGAVVGYRASKTLWPRMDGFMRAAEDRGPSPRG